MGQMVIRNIPDDVMERFKAVAKKAGKSAEQLAREAIAEKAKLDREQLMQQMDEIRARSKPVEGFDIVREIRKGRERDRVWEVLGDDDY